MTIGDVYREIDRIAPFYRAERWDNSGLLVGSMADDVTGVTLALDITGPVVEEAAGRGDSLIVAHHPVIFEPLRKVERDSPVYRLIRAGIGAICAHTPLDASPEGVGYTLANRLELQNPALFETSGSEHGVKIVVFVPAEHAEAVRDAMGDAGAGEMQTYAHCSFRQEGIGRFLPLSGAHPAIGAVGAVEEVLESRIEMVCGRNRLHEVIRRMKAAHPYEVPAYDIFENEAITEAWGFGLVGKMARTMETRVFADHVKRALGVDHLRVYDAGRPIRTVALCGGSGGGMLMSAARAGADAYVTADLKHASYLEAAALGMTLIDAGHFATENPVMEVLRRMLMKRFPALPITVAEANTPPYRMM